MSGYYPSLSENKLINIVRAIRDCLNGRSNAFGQFTLTANAASTTVAAENCAPESSIALMPMTANAAAALATTFITSANITAGQFVLTHANNAQVDKTFRYAIQG